MEVRYEPTINLNNVSSSNLLLRSIWATFRKELGLSWQYSPRKDSEAQTVQVGYCCFNELSKELFDNGNREPATVSYTYKVRGVIKELIFKLPKSWGEHLSLDNLSVKILDLCLLSEKTDPVRVHS